MHWLVLSVLVLVSLGFGPRHAAGQTSSCDGDLLAALGRRADGDLDCHAKAAKDGVDASAVCLAKSEARFIVAAAKAEARGDCIRLGDRSLLADISSRYHTLFAAVLRPVDHASACARAKLRATGDGARDTMTCFAKQLATGTAPNGCFTKAEDKLMVGFSKAETREACLTASDSGVMHELTLELIDCALGRTEASCPSILRAIAINVAPGSVLGYVPLDLLGIVPTPMGDDEIINFDVEPFVYNNATYTRIGVSSNGYIVVGGAEDGTDNAFTPQTLPNPARPNNVLAPFWTDLDGRTAPGILITTVVDLNTVAQWIVVEWRVHVFGTTSLRVFQAWIGANGVQDITFAYDPENLPASPGPGMPVNVGAENADGTVGNQVLGLPTEDVRVTSTIGL
jgi:hypothetical protein